ncbi:hypothetical protein [Pseudaquabacterium pictum]|uniref:Nitrogen fixation protein FixH n=1 Tax=Pseudaquabacterium pictum TaxID=2315236 RepID=A0A480AQP0_9BURK|nr:hypothetical protein [Rubrivivax pictus]GCL62412.1 hypothetical protein AQPW35_14930 [Rubrivivax pictus]
MTTPASNTPTPRNAADTSPPWWRVGMVWLVLGGPAVVVVAAIGTAVIAYRGADPVLTEAPTPQQVVRQLGAQTPAMQARNHAATPAPR